MLWSEQAEADGQHAVFLADTRRTAGLEAVGKGLGCIEKGGASCALVPQQVNGNNAWLCYLQQAGAPQAFIDLIRMPHAPSLISNLGFRTMSRQEVAHL